MSHHHTLILNQFPPLKRKSLLCWVNETPRVRRGLHQSFVAAMEVVPSRQVYEQLDLKTKITFSVLSEFGSRLENPMVLVNAVDDRLLVRSLPTNSVEDSSSG